MRRTPSLLALAIAAVAVTAPVAHAQSTATIQYAGDPFTYLIQGRPGTELSVTFQVTAPLPAGARMTVQTAGGSTLGSHPPRAIGTSGLCYRAEVTLSSATASGNTVSVVLAYGGQQLQPNPELVRLITARKASTPTQLVAGADC